MSPIADSIVCVECGGRAHLLTGSRPTIRRCPEMSLPTAAPTAWTGSIWSSTTPTSRTTDSFLRNYGKRASTIYARTARQFRG